MELTVYSAELLCDFPDWWRFNIYMMIVGYDREGTQIGFDNLTDRVFDMEFGGTDKRKAPENYDAQRPLFLKSSPCDYAEIYVYAVTNTFPESEIIKDSPPFKVELRVRAGDRLLESRHYEVNQWGGLTIVAHRADASAG